MLIIPSIQNELTNSSTLHANQLWLARITSRGTLPFIFPARIAPHPDVGQCLRQEPSSLPISFAPSQSCLSREPIPPIPPSQRECLCLVDRQRFYDTKPFLACSFRSLNTCCDPQPHTSDQANHLWVVLHHLGPCWYPRSSG